MVKKMSFNPKYIWKMFSLKQLLINFCIFKLVFFVRVARNQGCVSRKVFSLKNIWADWYWYSLSSRFFNNNAWNIDTAAEVYLELFQTYILSFLAKIINGFRRKGSILTGMVLNIPCSYRDSLYYYKRDETSALHSSEVQVNHQIDNGSNQ